MFDMIEYLPEIICNYAVGTRTNSGKGQIKPKADLRAIDSPEKRTNEVGFFAMTVWKYLKLEISISSLKYFRTVKQKKSTVHQSLFDTI